MGLDVIALVGALRSAEHRRIPALQRHLVARGVALGERTVTNWWERYDERLAVSLTDDTRLGKLLAQPTRGLLALEGLQPDAGHEVLWVLRACLSGEVRLAKSLLAARQADRAALLGTARDGLPVPIAGGVSDGPQSMRKAVAPARPEVPHQLCHVH